jgi:hypothetical protein
MPVQAGLRPHVRFDAMQYAPRHGKERIASTENHERWALYKTQWKQQVKFIISSITHSHSLFACLLSSSLHFFALTALSIFELTCLHFPYHF